MVDLATWTNENTLSLITIVLAAIGGVFAYLQWARSIKIRRAEFMNQIIETLRFDKEISKAVYLIDYDPLWYDESFHRSDEKEYLIDKLFSCLSYICYLIESGSIKKAEVKVLDYELRRACESLSGQAYLWNLYWWSKSRQTNCSFQHLIDYGISNKIISRNDFQKSSTKYPKRLNFDN
jgi:hypothetical protein